MVITWTFTFLDVLNTCFYEYVLLAEWHTSNASAIAI